MFKFYISWDLSDRSPTSLTHLILYSTDLFLGADQRIAQTISACRALKKVECSIGVHFTPPTDGATP